MAASKSGKAAPAETGNGLSKIEQLGVQLDQDLEYSEASLASQVAARCILGHDPGISGATGFYFPAFDRLAVDDNPVVGSEFDAATFAERIRQMRPTLAIVEAVASRPGQGVVSTFKFGRSYGAALGVLATLAIPVHLVSPTKWKRHFGLDGDKERSRALALRLWPGRSDLFGRKRDHNRAESALLARYLAELGEGGR
jgi:hypothetical protein